MLNKLMSFICVLCAFSSGCIAEIADFSDDEEGKKYNLSICAIFNDEAYHLKDWIDHHLQLGVDHFYLYNIGSQDHFYFVLIPYINEGLVTLVNWPGKVKENTDKTNWALSTQIPAYENAVNFIAKDETEWLLLSSIDEFLVCPKGNLADLLIDYHDVPGIALSTDVLDGSVAVPLSPMLYTISGDSSDIPNHLVENAVAKMIFKPDLCKGFMWPPYQCRFETNQTNIQADPKELRINHYVNRNKKARSGIKAGPKPSVKTSSLSEKLTLEQWQEESGYENNLPIYNCMPRFLKKLKNQHEGHYF